MIVAVSPYHLTTREPPAIVSAQLAERVVTLLPAPAGGGAGAMRAAERVPSFLKFTQSFAWSLPLWKAGVLSGGIGEDAPLADVREVAAAIRADDRYAALRVFLHAEVYDDERAYLAAVSKDLLKAGPDPGLSVPVVAAIDRYATRRSLFAARPPATSLAQSAEAGLARRVFAVGVPALLQADAARVLHCREVLADVLEDLWASMGELPATVREGRGVSATTVQRIGDAAEAYTQAFQDRREQVFEGSADDEVRAVESMVSITGAALPSDAALRSSVAAMARVGGEVPGPAPGGNLPARYDPLEGRSFVALFIKPLGTRG